MWRDADARARSRHWPAVERLLARLPPALRERAKLVEYELALRWSDTGQLRGAFAGVETPPIMSLGTWLLDDLAADAGGREDAVRRLLVAGVLLAARVHVAERLRDEAAFHDPRDAVLVGWLTERATAELRAAVPPGSPVHERLDEVALDDAESALERWSPGGPDAGVVHPGPWAAPLQRIALAALAAASRPDLAQDVVRLVDALAAGLNIRAEVATLDADVHAGRVTYPIATVARAAGIPLGPPPERERLLGAMVATGAMGGILAAAAGHLGAARAGAAGAGLPMLAAWLAGASTAIEDRMRATEGEAARPSVRPLIERAVPPIAAAVDMAERFLLADPTLREGWETHREGMLGAPEVASRYPAGLVLEILGRHGVDVAAPVDAFLEFTVANGFRYYDHPRSDPDTDTIGVFLRLRAFATVPEVHDAALVTVLGTVRSETARSGAIPVWLRPPGTPDGDASDGMPPVIALGEGCATVAAHLLLGLRELGREVDRPTVDLGVAALVDRIVDVGLAANVNYPPFYSLAVLCRLLGNRPPARAVLDRELETRLRRPAATPQDAALRTLACIEAGRPDLVDAAWRPAILRGQRMDGSWLPEPFAPAPNRGAAVTWYSSATLSTALCYDALRRGSPGAPRAERQRFLDRRGQIVA